MDKREICTNAIRIIDIAAKRGTFEGEELFEIGKFRVLLQNELTEPVEEPRQGPQLLNENEQPVSQPKSLPPNQGTSGKK